MALAGVVGLAGLPREPRAAFGGLAVLTGLTGFPRVPRLALVLLAAGISFSCSAALPRAFLATGSSDGGTMAVLLAPLLGAAGLAALVDLAPRRVVAETSGTTASLVTAAFLAGGRAGDVGLAGLFTPRLGAGLDGFTGLATFLLREARDTAACGFSETADFTGEAFLAAVRF